MSSGVVAWLDAEDESPLPRAGSGHSVTVWHAEAGHGVEDFARQLSLVSLTIKGSTSHSSTDDRLVSVHGILNHAALTVA